MKREDKRGRFADGALDISMITGDERSPGQLIGWQLTGIYSHVEEDTEKKKDGFDVSLKKDK